MAVAVSELTYPALLPRVADFVRREHQMFINGEWVSAQSGETLEVFDPATGETIAHVPAGNAADIDAAVMAARRAFDTGPWRRIKPADRAKLMWKLADLVEDHASELAQIESLDNGKPYQAALNADVAGSIEMLRYFSGWATKLEGNEIPFATATPGTYFAYTRREAIGVVGQIIPWNFPLMMAAWKIAPALATGCTIVLKPA